MNSLITEDISKLFDLFSLRKTPIIDLFDEHLSWIDGSLAGSIVERGIAVQPDTKKITRMIIDIFPK